LVQSRIPNFVVSGSKFIRIFSWKVGGWHNNLGTNFMGVCDCSLMILNLGIKLKYSSRCTSIFDSPTIRLDFLSAFNC